MSRRFDAKVAFVSGATSGIGRATALAFAREGASVVVADVADVAADGNQETARMIDQAGGRSFAVACDVTCGEEIKAALDAAVDRFGRLDIAFNNPASSSRSSRPPSGAIVNTSSGAGVKGFKGQAAYAAIRAARIDAVETV